MLMPVRGGVWVALVAVCAAIGAPAAAAAPPQGIQPDATFAASYAQHAVTSIAATAQRVSCYSPEVYYQASLEPSQGFPDGGSTLCNGTATTGEEIGPYASQDVANPPLKAKDFSESDIHVDPTNPRHVIGVTKWIVNAEGYNHLAGFFESFDGGVTWPQAGHIPGYEGWTDNSDPVGAFDPWGNFYAVVFPYMFSYGVSGEHFFLSPTVNPSLPRSVLGGRGQAARRGNADGLEHNSRRRARRDRAHSLQGQRGLRQAMDRDRHESAQPPLRPGLRVVGDRQRRQRAADLCLPRRCAGERNAHELVCSPPRPA